MKGGLIKDATKIFFFFCNSGELIVGRVNRSLAVQVHGMALLEPCVWSPLQDKYHRLATRKMLSMTRSTTCYGSNHVTCARQVTFRYKSSRNNHPASKDCLALLCAAAHPIYPRDQQTHLTAYFPIHRIMADHIALYVSSADVSAQQRAQLQHAFDTAQDFPEIDPRPGGRKS